MAASTHGTAGSRHLQRGDEELRYVRGTPEGRRGRLEPPAFDAGGTSASSPRTMLCGRHR